MILRPYQKIAVSDACNALDKHGNTLVVAPTGAGKTIMLSALIGERHKAGKRVLVIQHRDVGVDRMNICDVIQQSRGIIQGLIGSLIRQFIRIKPACRYDLSSGVIHPADDLILGRYCEFRSDQTGFLKRPTHLLIRQEPVENGWSAQM